MAVRLPHIRVGFRLNDRIEWGGLTADLADAFDVSPNPYMLLTPELRYAGMNRAYLEVTRRTREELLGRHVMDAFDAGGDDDNARQLRHSFERVLATGQPDHIALLHYAIPLPDDDGVVRYVDKYWSCTHTPLLDGEGRLRFILQHTTDVSELQALRRQVDAGETGMSALDAIVGGRVLRQAETVQADNRRLEHERNRLVEMFMQAPGFVAVLGGPNHIFQMHNRAYSQLVGGRDLTGKPLTDALPEIEAQGFIDLLDSVRRSGKPFEGRAVPVHLQRTADGPLETRYLDFVYQPIRGDSDEVVGIFVQGHDVTETVHAAEQQKLMIDELNHRVKNTLATVQSIAMQTARSHDDPASFAEAFQARLMALSNTHDLLTRSHWRGADLREVLEHETAAHEPHRVSLTGPAVALQPAAALALGMVFHELATNAAKYGALSAAGGRVLIDWSITQDAGPMLKILWREVGGPPVSPPTRKGFGSRLIERSMRHELAGAMRFDYAEDGLVAELSIPMKEFES